MARVNGRTDNKIRELDYGRGAGFKAAIDRRAMPRERRTSVFASAPLHEHCRPLCSKRAHIIGRCDAACIYPRFPGPRENLYFPGRKINVATRRANPSLARGDSSLGAAGREPRGSPNAATAKFVSFSLSPRDLNSQEISLSSCIGAKVNEWLKAYDNFLPVRDAHFNSIGK